MPRAGAGHGGRDGETAANREARSGKVAQCGIVVDRLGHSDQDGDRDPSVDSISSADSAFGSRNAKATWWSPGSGAAVGVTVTATIWLARGAGSRASGAADTHEDAEFGLHLVIQYTIGTGGEVRFSTWPDIGSFPTLDTRTR